MVRISCAVVILDKCTVLTLALCSSIDGDAYAWTFSTFAFSGVLFLVVVSSHLFYVLFSN